MIQSKTKKIIKKSNPPSSPLKLRRHAVASSLLLRATAGEATPLPKATAGEERSKRPDPLRQSSRSDSSETRQVSEASKRAEIKSTKIKEEIKNMATKDILEKAKKELADLTGFKSPSAVGFKKEGNELIATIEVIEKESIPDGMDVLGTYEVRVEQDGKIIGYERTDLRKRVDTALNRET